MKSIKLSIALMFVAMLSFSSCSTRLVDFTVISSKNHSLNIDVSQGTQVSGSSIGFLGMGTSIKDAMDKALESAGPGYDILVDGVVRVKNYVFVSGFQVEGTAINSSKMKKSLGEKGFNQWIEANNVFNPKTATVFN